MKQGRIHDFPGRRKPRRGEEGGNQLFGQMFLKTALKWKQLNREGDASKILQSRSATVKGSSEMNTKLN